MEDNQKTFFSALRTRFCVHVRMKYCEEHLMVSLRVYNRFQRIQDGTFNPRPPETFSVTRPPKGDVATPSL